MLAHALAADWILAARSPARWQRPKSRPRTHRSELPARSSARGPPRGGGTGARALAGLGGARSHGGVQQGQGGARWHIRRRRPDLFRPPSLFFSSVSSFFPSCADAYVPARTTLSAEILGTSSPPDSLEYFEWDVLDSWMPPNQAPKNRVHPIPITPHPCNQTLPSSAAESPPQQRKSPVVHRMSSQQ